MMELLAFLFSLVDSSLIIDNHILYGSDDDASDIVLTPELGIEIINENAFKDNKYIQKIIMNNPLKYIMDEAFSNCQNLYKIVINPHIEYIGYKAFFNCTKANIEFHFSKTLRVCKEAFVNCYFINNLNFHENTTLEDGAFLNTTFSKSITIISYSPINKSFIGAKFNNGLTIKSTEILPKAFKRSKIAGTLNLLVKDIGSNCFESSFIHELKMGTIVKTVGKFCFMNARFLKDLSYFNSRILLEGALMGALAPSLTLYASMIPEKFAYNSSIPKIILKSTNDKISVGIMSFAYSQIESIELMADTHFGSNTFLNCKSLKNIIFSQFFKANYGAFSGCTSLKSIEIEELAPFLFASSGLETIKFNTDFIPESCFENCIYLKEVQYTESDLIISKRGFKGCKALQRTFNFSTVQTEGLSGSGITSVNLSKFIGDSAFFNCQQLQNITLSGKIAIPTNAFSACQNIKNIIIDGEIQLESDSFSDSKIDILELRNVNEIDQDAFNCTTVEVVIYKLKKNLMMEKRLFQNSPHFIFVDFTPTGNVLGYPIKSYALEIALGTLGGVLLVAFITTLVLYLVKKNHRLQRRIELEKSIINDFG